VLASDDSYAGDYTPVVPAAAPAAGTEDVIDNISIYNKSGNTAEIRLAIGT
jgi:hypothetical protein